MGPKAKKLKMDDTCKGEAFILELSHILRSQGFDLDFKALAKKFKKSKQSEFSLRYYFNNKLIPDTQTDHCIANIHDAYSKYMDILRDHPETLGPASNLPKAFEIYALLGPHPALESCGGVDYPAIYRALAACMRGHLPPDLNVQTAAKLLAMINELERRVDLMMSSPSWKPQRTVRRPTWRKDVPTSPERNAELKDRREKDWTAKEWIAHENAMSDDMAKIWLTLGPEIAFNPFGYVFPH